MLQLTRRTCLISAAAAAASSLCSHASFAQPPSKRAAIVCFSRTGNTWAIAQMIAEITKADLFRIDVQDAYAENYNDMTYVAQAEVRRHAKRALKTPLPNLSSYQTVFVGSPLWWSQLSTPMNTFLMDEPLAGKNVFPFTTSASSSPDGVFERVRELVKGTVGEPFYVSSSDVSGARGDVAAWLKRIGF